MTVRTDIFSGTPSAYVRRVGVQLLWRWWWAWLTPVAACFVVAAWEAVWVFVGFMLLFMLYPGLMLMVYYYYAFSPKALLTLQPKTVELSDGTMTVIYCGERHIEPRTYTRADIKSVETGRKTVTGYFRKPRYSHLSIPLSAVPDSQRTDFLTLCDNLAPDLA